MELLPEATHDDFPSRPFTSRPFYTVMLITSYVTFPFLNLFLRGLGKSPAFPPAASTISGCD